MTIKRASIAIAAAGALALGVASPVMATPAQAKQIMTLKLELAKADKTIAARNATIKTDAAELIAAGGGISAMKPMQVWALMPAIYTVLNNPAVSVWNVNCGWAFDVNAFQSAPGPLGNLGSTFWFGTVYGGAC